jgi:hypothetical protein
MRIVVVQRSALAGEELYASDSAAPLLWSSVVESLDRHDVPDGLPYDTITEVVLPAFTPEQVNQARQQANLTPIDAGVLNDMRGVPEAPAS